MRRNRTKRRAARGTAVTVRLLAAALLFGAGYAIANRFPLVHTVAYRLAAGDPQSAATAFLFLALQAAVFLAALFVFSRRRAAMLLVLAGASMLVNIGYAQLVGELLDAGSLAWLIAEVRQAGNAAGEFGGELLWVAVQVAAALALFVAARRLARSAVPWRGGTRWGAVTLALLIAPSILYRHAAVWPEGTERSLYGLAIDLATAPPPPPRGAVAIVPNSAANAPRHIVWVIDESVAEAPFRKLIAPKLANTPHVDFGVAAAMGHCSAPAQVALRSGVDVRRVGPRTDLRRTPSIWAYAKGAGYRTAMIDGQTSGAPQNLLLPPERALIDAYRPMPGGVDTDLKIADAINRDLKGEVKTFTYAVLRGVHFQYRDHYPAGAIPADSPVALHYATALRWSKGRFFERLLDGIDRERVAIVYTSDHGQNLTPGALPHCSAEAVADEFRVPLLAFLPPRIAARYADAPLGGHSVSQIFPATLIWMGYDAAAVTARYDNDLSERTARFVWFGRTVIPTGGDAAIDVTAGSKFPGE
ncbi:sulfatase-like hydrolase/transferase [Sphingopyxis kveilinensis]|uniref:sulfatase-like hydrolase/transferase n=1 Tax=Sphingopyxis kveilinensis TaxID=3114367 RepID=UPI0030D43648